MKKNIIILILIFFVQYFLLEAFFVRLDAYTPWNKTGNPMASALSFIFTIFSCVIMFVVLALEKLNKTQFKKIVLFILFVHCVLHFFWEAFFEYNLFTDSESFDISSVIIILTYFLFELILTFYVINRLYKSEDK